jgi:hypothetical protein
LQPKITLNRDDEAVDDDSACEALPSPLSDTGGLRPSRRGGIANNSEFWRHAPDGVFGRSLPTEFGGELATGESVIGQPNSASQTSTSAGNSRLGRDRAEFAASPVVNRNCRPIPERLDGAGCNDLG